MPNFSNNHWIHNLYDTILMATETKNNSHDSDVENYILLLKGEGKSIRDIVDELKEEDTVYKGKAINYSKVQQFLAKQKATNTPPKVDVKEVVAKAKEVGAQVTKEIATTEEIIKLVEVKRESIPAVKVEEVKEVATEENSKEEATDTKKAIQEQPQEKAQNQDTEEAEQAESTTKEKQISRSNARPKSPAELRKYLRNR